MNRTLDNILERIVEISTICNPGDEYAKEYAKSAIRDVFIQMPTRSVYQIYMPAYLNQISSTFGKNETIQAWKELQTEGWVSTRGDKYFWKKEFGPIVPGLSERTKLNELLDESPDFTIGKNLKRYYWDAGENMAFGFIDDVLLLGWKKSTHAMIGDLYPNNPTYRNDFQFPGRMWVDLKIISFWRYPKKKSTIIKILHQIQKSYPFVYIYRDCISHILEQFFKEYNKTDFRPSFEFMMNEYISGDIDSLVTKIKSLPTGERLTHFGHTAEEIIADVLKIYNENKNFSIGNIDDYIVDTPGGYEDWDKLDSDGGTPDSLYDKINNTNKDDILVPITKYSEELSFEDIKQPMKCSCGVELPSEYDNENNVKMFCNNCGSIIIKK